MEFSVSKAIQKLRPTVTKKAFPRLSSTPAENDITPGNIITFFLKIAKNIY